MTNPVLNIKFNLEIHSRSCIKYQPGQPKVNYDSDLKIFEVIIKTITYETILQTHL